MGLTTSAYISLFALLSYCGLLVITLTRDVRKRLAVSFSAYLASMIIWSFGSFMLFVHTGLPTPLFWNRFLVIGSTAMPIAFFAFVRNFLMRDWRNWLVLGYVLYAITQVANGLGWVVTDVQIYSEQIHNVYGPAIIFTVFTWLFFVGFSTIELIQEYVQTVDVLYRNRLKYLLVVIIAILLGSLTNATPLRVFPVDIAFNLIAAILIAYAILRHQLLDITVVFRKSLLYSIPTILIGASYFLVISLVLRIFSDITGAQIFLLSLLVAILTALIAQPVRDKAQALIDRLFYREKFDSNRMLQRLSSSAGQMLNLEALTLTILDDVSATMHLTRAGFLLRRRENSDFYLSAQKGIENGPPLRLRSDHPLVTCLAESSQPVTRYQLDVLPQFRALWRKEREDLARMGMELYIPLKAKGELVGIFTVGPKRSEQSFSQDEQATMVALANQTAATIENAILFDAEERRRLEAEVLQNAMAELTSALDLQQVLDGLLENLRPVIPCYSACVFLKRGEGFSVAAARGFSDLKQALTISVTLEDDPLFQEIQRTGRPLVVDDTQKDPRFGNFGHDPNIHCWMGVPLLVRGSVIGCLTLDSHESGVYNDGEVVSLAQAFANNAAIAVENARLFQVEREQRQLAVALREVGAVLSTTLDIDQLLDLLLDQIVRVVPYESAAILLVEDGHFMTARTRFTAELIELEMDSIPMPDLTDVMENGHPLVIPNVLNENGWPEKSSSIRSWMAVPILSQGKVIACFVLASREPNFYRPDHGDLLSIFSGQAALALQNASLFSEMHKLAITDDLTAIYNRRHLYELGEREFNRAVRFGRPLCAMMLDLDLFKSVNDQHGHAVGDQVLRQVAQRCRDNIREFDLLGRYGGEEFVALLPETSLEDAHTIVERLRQRIAETRIETSAGPIEITVSLGVASLDAGAKNLEDLIDLADRAMYAAKKNGRNFVCTTPEIDTRELKTRLDFHGKGVIEEE